MFARIKGLGVKDAISGSIHVMIPQGPAVRMAFALMTKSPEKHHWVTDVNVTFGGAVRVISTRMLNDIRRCKLYVI